MSAEFVEMESVTIDKRVYAIVRFGPASPVDGYDGRMFLQALIDPNMVSPQGDFIRFDQRFQPNTEIHGWQRVDAITVCEILGDMEGEYKEVPPGYTVVPDASVTLRKATYG